MKKKQTRQTGGFTLLEMLIAVGIFSVISLLASSSAFLFHRLQRKAVNAQNVHDNIRFALDTMAREIRTGDKYCASTLPVQCEEVETISDGNNDCDWSSGVPGEGGCDTFSFRESLAATNIAYRLDATAPGGGAIQKSIDNGVTWDYITDPERTISQLRFYVSGINDPGEQERVTIVLEVKSAYLAKPGEESKLLLQTTIAKLKLQP